MNKDLDIIEGFPKIFELSSYQRLDGDVTDNNRVPESIKSLEYFKGNYELLDVGCSAGLYSFIASRYCEKVRGLEPIKEYYNESIIIEDYFKRNLADYYDTDKVKLFNMGVEDYRPNVLPDAVLALNVTHQLSDNAMVVLVEFLEYADSVIMMIRPNFPNIHNGFELNKPDKVCELLFNSGKSVHVKRINDHRVLVLSKRAYHKEKFDLRDFPCLLNRLINQTGKFNCLKLHVDGLSGERTIKGIFESMEIFLCGDFYSIKTENHAKQLYGVYESIRKKGYNLDYTKRDESLNFIENPDCTNYRKDITIYFNNDNNRYELIDGSRRLASLYVLDLPIPVRVEVP